MKKNKNTENISKILSTKMSDSNPTRHMTMESGNEETPRHPVLVVVSGNLLDVGRILPIGREVSCIGRDATTDLPLNDRLVSRKHIEIVDLKQSNGVFSILVKDLGSTNGTYVKGKRIKDEWVKLGETIEIGAETILLFRTESFTKIQDSNLTLCMISRDPLTGVYNRRAFEQLVEHAHEKARDSSSNYCLILVDVDYFKEINDSMGHPTGDRVLKAIAMMIRSEIRSEDIVARIGGDEFAVLLPSSGILGGSRLAERLLTSIKKLKHENGNSMNVTLSMGISNGSSETRRPADIYKRADLALYHSKKNGRNRYTVYDESIHDATQVNLTD